MIRMLIAALILTATVPAFACDYNKSAGAAPHSSAVASQPTNGHATPPSGAVSTPKQS